MVFIEIVALLVVAAVLIVAIVAIGRPVAEVLADKTRNKMRALDSEAEQLLLKRVEALEEELRQTRKQMTEMKESVDFTVKMIESNSEAKILNLSSEVTSD